MGNSEAKTAVIDEMGRIRNANADDFNINTFTALLSADVDEDTIFKSLNPEDIRDLRKQKPVLLSKLIQTSIYLLQKVIRKHAPMEAEDKTTILNSMRFLTRILPIIFEHDDDKFITKVLWFNIDPNHPIPDDGEQMEEATGDVQIRVGNDEGNVQLQSKPYAAILVDSLMELLFIPGFTVAASNEKFGKMDYHTVDQTLAWTPGVFVKGSVHYTSEQFETSRYTVLKCLIAVSSMTVYSPLAESVDDLNPFLWLLTSRYTKNIYNLFYSLLNSIVTYNPNASKVPYMNARSERMVRYLDICTQLFMIMTDFRMPSYPRLQELLANSRIHQKCNHVLTDWKRDYDKFVQSYGGVSRQDDPAVGNKANKTKLSEEESKSALEAGETPLIYSNAFIETLGNVKGRDDCLLIYDGICRLLKTLIDSKNTYLYGSVVEIGFQQELIYMFWKFICHNQHFLFNFLYRADKTKITVSIVYLLVRSCTDPAQLGLFHMCTFMLMYLSAEREYAVSLNKACMVSLPVDLPLFTGSYADLVIISIHKVVETHFAPIQPMFDGLLTVIANISPYMMQISLISSRKLLKLLEIFLTEQYLFRGPEGYMGLVYILETFNNLVQYQYSTSSALVYMLLRCRTIFETIRGFSLHHRPLKPVLTQNAHNEQMHEQIARPTNIQAATDTNGEGLESARKTNRAEAEEEERERRNAALEESKGLIGQSALGGEDDDDDEPTSGKDFKLSEELKKEDDAEKLKVSEEKSQRKNSSLAVINPNDKLNTADERPTKLNEPWRVTDEWISQWKQKLPLAPVMKLIYNLYPRVQEYCSEKSVSDDTEIIDYIKTTTMVGLLPVPHPILIRKFQESRETRAWITSFIWGVVFQRNKHTPMFDSQKLKLFTVTSNTENLGHRS